MSYLSEVISFFAGLAGGATIGSLVTLRITRGHSANNGGRVVDQRGGHAGGDIVGGDKTTSLRQ